jgi:carboxyl-terminal processing protease
MKSARLVSPLFLSGKSLLKIVLFAAALFVPALSLAQTIPFQRERSREILKVIRSDVEKNYYDPTFHGVDLNAVFSEADALLKKADSAGQMYGIIARALLQLNDSHTYFVPPSRVAKIQRGWSMQVIGDKIYISSVQPGSDADRKGVKPGDLVVSVDEMNPTRENLWMIQYLFVLRPQPATLFHLETPGGETRKLEIQARVSQGRKITDLTDYEQVMRLQLEEEKDGRLNRHRYVKVEEVFFWKMPAFDLPPDKVDDMIGKVKGSKALILDLRGNGGGAEDTLLRMIGNLFDRDIILGELKQRKQQKTMIAKSRGNAVYKGQVIILTDGASGSSSELLARVVQLEKRGTVIGDRSAGAVMRGRFVSRSAGVDTVIFYGLSVTDADLVMTDGRSLERVGVTPDEIILPTAADLSKQRDPVLSRAAELAGLKISSETAGTMFPVEWR